MSSFLNFMVPQNFWKYATWRGSFASMGMVRTFLQMLPRWNNSKFKGVYLMSLPFKNRKRTLDAFHIKGHILLKYKFAAPHIGQANSAVTNTGLCWIKIVVLLSLETPRNGLTVKRYLADRVAVQAVMVRMCENSEFLLQFLLPDKLPESVSCSSVL